MKGLSLHAVILLITAAFAVAEAAFAAKGATIGVIASDMPHLAIQTSRDIVPSDPAIEAMVREAMELGGIRQVLRPEVQHVLLKPCIVTAQRDPQRNTDPRTVRAVALVVHEIAPHARITVADGPGAWMKEARPEVKHWELVITDGFETEGYYAALDDPRLKDARIDFVDLNCEFDAPRSEARQAGELDHERCTGESAPGGPARAGCEGVVRLPSVLRFYGDGRSVQIQG